MDSLLNEISDHLKDNEYKQNRAVDQCQVLSAERGTSQIAETSFVSNFADRIV